MSLQHSDESDHGEESGKEGGRIAVGVFLLKAATEWLVEDARIPDPDPAGRGGFTRSDTVG